jgi:hypothetical protein
LAGKVKEVGVFDTKEQAAAAYDREARRQKGEEAICNYNTLEEADDAATEAEAQHILLYLAPVAQQDGDMQDTEKTEEVVVEAEEVEEEVMEEEDEDEEEEDLDLVLHASAKSLDLVPRVGMRVQVWWQEEDSDSEDIEAEAAAEAEAEKSAADAEAKAEAEAAAEAAAVARAASFIPERLQKLVGCSVQSDFGTPRSPQVWEGDVTKIEVTSDGGWEIVVLFTDGDVYRYAEDVFETACMVRRNSTAVLYLQYNYHSIISACCEY